MPGPLSLLLLALLAGSLVYCVLMLVAARRYLAVRPPPLALRAPISILKPLDGVDEGLEENLRSFFDQRYHDFEILAAVRNPGDPAIIIFERLQREYPGISARMLITGEPPYPNAKVFSLDRMLAEARHSLLVMSDSDIRVTADMLRTVAAEFQQAGVDLATCPYRAIAGHSFWSRLEAAGMNTEFWGSALVARMLEGMRFAVGPTIVARKEVLQKIGGFERLKDYLAEDFVMGKFAAEANFGVILSSYVIEHRIGTQGFLENAKHRIRWARSTRRSRPAGYLGEIFTNPLPILLALLIAEPRWWPLAIPAMLLRAAAARIVAWNVLHHKTPWLLLPLQDLASFAFWVAGFFGNTIAWRGRKYDLLKDGRFELTDSK